MKRVFILCLIGMAAIDTQAAMSYPPQPVQAFSAVVWTTTTLHSPTGKSFAFMQRTVCTRDASGHTRREIYKPTKGLKRDMTAPLERVITGTTSAQTIHSAQLNKNVVEEDVDLGTLQFSGLPASGTRQSFQAANGQRTQTVETWFSTTLGLTVHMERHNAHGDTVVSDLSELHLGNPTLSAAEAAKVAGAEIPLLTLYRGLFAQISQMERDKQANDPNLHVNMDEIEDHLRKKMSLSASEWGVLVDKSVKVETYTREVSKQARSFADQDRAARQQNPLSARTPAAGRATLHQMQLDLNTHLQGEIDQLKATVGPDGADHIQAYLQGPLAASMSIVPSKSAELRAHKEQVR